MSSAPRTRAPRAAPGPGPGSSRRTPGRTSPRRSPCSPGRVTTWSSATRPWPRSSPTRRRRTRRRGSRSSTCPLALGSPRPPNVAIIEIRPRDAAYLAGWLAGRMERLRRGPDAVGAVGGYPIPPVDEFIVRVPRGRAARHAGRPRPDRLLAQLHRPDGVRGRSPSDRSRRAPGCVFDVAGGCGPGTLDGRAGGRDLGGRGGPRPLGTRAPHPDERGEALRPRIRPADASGAE